VVPLWWRPSGAPKRHCKRNAFPLDGKGERIAKHANVFERENLPGSVAPATRAARFSPHYERRVGDRSRAMTGRDTVRFVRYSRYRRPRAP
jgi:hypothetical protein